jgi:uncharacterized protein (DUF302 family)
VRHLQQLTEQSEEELIMNRGFHFLLILLVLWVPTASAGDNGLITKPSAHSVTATLDRLEALLEKKGIGVALRWSHSDKADAVGIGLRPTELLVFGNPSLGSHMFTSAQTAGIDLPMKALSWQDESGQVWLTYNDPAYIAGRHGINDRQEIVSKMSAALAQLTDAATAP